MKKNNEMTINILMTVSGIWAKFIAILSSCWGWIAGICLSLLNFLIPLQYMFLLLGIIILFDFLAALVGAYKRNIHITSEKGRGTLIKALIYMLLISLTFSCEIIIGVSIAHKVLFAIACLIELYSLTANLLIIKPDMPFLKLFAGLVKGEISKKTEIKKEKIEEILTCNENKTNN